MPHVKTQTSDTQDGLADRRHGSDRRDGVDRREKSDRWTVLDAWRDHKLVVRSSLGRRRYDRRRIDRGYD